MLCFRFQVCYINMAVFITLHYYYLHPRHYCRSRIGTMRRNRYQHHITVRIAFRFVVSHNGKQAGILALSPAVWLQAAGIKAGDGVKVIAQLINYLLVALCLVSRCKGVNLPKFRPAYRYHFAGGIKLHRATAKAYHAGIER